MIHKSMWRADVAIVTVSFCCPTWSVEPKLGLQKMNIPKQGCVRRVPNAHKQQALTQHDLPGAHKYYCLLGN